MNRREKFALIEEERRQAYAATPACPSAAAFDHAIARVCLCTDAAIAMWRSARKLPAKLLPKGAHPEEARRRAAYDATPAQRRVGEFDALLARQSRCSVKAIEAWRRSRGLLPKVTRVARPGAAHEQ